MTCSEFWINNRRKTKYCQLTWMLKLYWTHGPYSQVILSFMCREWIEAFMLFRYDLKNSDVKCTAVFLTSLK